MAGVLFKKGGSGGVGSVGIWLIDVVRIGGTFLNLVRDTAVAGEVQSISSIQTDGTSLTLTLIGDRGVEYEPTVTVNGVAATRDATNTASADLDGTFRWVVTIPVADTISITSADGGRATVPVQLESPAIVTELTIIENPNSNQSDFYQNSQTELKQGDSVYVSFKTNKPIVSLVVPALSGANCASSGAYSANDLTYDVPTEVYTARLTIGRLSTIPDNITIQINTVTTQGAISTIAATTDNTVICNNQYPLIFWDVPNFVYPLTQTALKDTETATALTIQTPATFDTLLISTTRTGDLLLTSLDTPLTDENSHTFSRRAGGTNYYVTGNNVKLVANRLANDATTVEEATLAIANSFPTVSITIGPDASLRSGGNNNTNQQLYTVTISSTQRLIRAPTCNFSEGDPQNAGFTYTSTSQVFTRAIGIHDDMPRGTHNFNTLTATNMAGKVVNIFGGVSATSDFIIGGFVKRLMVMPAFGNEVTINVPVFVEANVTVLWQVTGNLLIRSLTDTPAVTTDKFFIENPTSTTPIIKLLDKSATDARSSESIVEVTETI